MSILKEIFYDIDDQIILGNCNESGSNILHSQVNNCLFINMTACGYGVLRRYNSLRNLKTRLNKLDACISNWVNYSLNPIPSRNDESIDPCIIMNSYAEANILTDELHKYLEPSQVIKETKSNKKEKGIKRRFCYDKLNDLVIRLKEFKKIMKDFRLANRKYSDTSNYKDLFIGIRNLVIEIVEFNIDAELKRLLDLTEEDRRTFFNQYLKGPHPIATSKILIDKLNQRINLLNIRRKGNRYEKDIEPGIDKH